MSMPRWFWLSSASRRTSRTKSGLALKNSNAARRTWSTLLQPSSSVGSATAFSTRANQSAIATSKTSRYRASFDAKWCSRLGRRIPTAPAMSFSEVPS